MGRKLEVEIIGDARSLERAFGHAGTVSEGFGHKLGSVAKMGALGLAAGIGVAGVALGESVKAAMSAQASQASLDQALRRTHQSVGDMKPALDAAEAASRKLGFSDTDTSRALARLELATGNTKKATSELSVVQDIARTKGLDLATAATTLAQAQTGSQRAAKQLGIIVQPVTSHLDALKASHANLTTASGKLLEAHAKMLDKMATGQAVIAATSDKVKGQAQAYSETAAGAMAQFHAQLEHLEVTLGTALLPALTKVATALASGVAWLEKSKRAHEIVAGAAHGLGVAFHYVGEAIEVVRAHWTQISAVLAKVGEEIAKAFSTIVAIVRGAVTVIEALWNTFGSTILSFVEGTFNNLMEIFRGAFNVIEGVFRLFADIIHGRWGQVWKDVEQIVTGAWQLIDGLFSQALNTLVTIAKLIGEGILKAIEVPLKGLVHVAASALHALVAAIKGVAAAALGAAESVGKSILQGLEFYFVKLPQLALTWVGKALKGILTLADDALTYAEKVGKELVQGILNGVGGLYGELKHKLEGTLHSVVNDLNPFSPVSHGGEKYIGRPLAEGTIQGWVLGSQPLGGAISKTVRAAVEQGRRAVASERGAFSSAWAVLTADATKAFDAQTTILMNAVQAKFAKAKADLDRQTQAALARLDAQGQALTPEEQKVADEQNAHDEAARMQAIADAQAQLAQAQAAGDAQQILQAQRALNDAKYQEQLAADQKAADASRVAEDAKVKAQKQAVEEQAKEHAATLATKKKLAEQHLREQRSLEKQHMEEQLKELKKQLEKTGATQKAAQEKVIAMLKGYGITYKASGKLLGESFAAGLLDAESAVGKAAAKIAQAAANALQLHSPAKTGPLSTLDTWWKPLGPTLVKGIDMRDTDGAIARVAAGALRGGSGLGTSTRAGYGGGGVEVHLHLDGATIIGNDKRKVAEELVSEITLALRNNQRIGGASPVL